MRHDGRRADELRALDIEPDYLEQPHGSVLYAQGKTIVLCTATVEEEVPRWLRKSGRGWMTAEYAMLPASTGERTQRAVSRGRPDGRTVEIQRLIGRALRSVCDFEALGERTLWLDCDVLQADGGTRCASITGAWIAARRALDRFGLSKALPGTIAAVSVGIVDGEAVLDLDYEEDSSAETDMNVVMTGDGRLVEVQATAERDPFSRELLDALLDLAAGGIEELAAAQAEAAAAPAARRRCSVSLSRASRATRTSSRELCSELLLASHNENKLRELGALPVGVALSTPDEPVEDGATFLDNARIKARHGRTHAPADAWVAGEDSGIEVAALGRTARRALGSVGRGRRRAASPRARRADGSPRALRVRARRARSRRRARYTRRERWTGTIADGRRGRRGLRLRPDLRSGRRDAHRGRARQRVEGRALAPRPGRPRSRTSARESVVFGRWTRPRRSGS